MPPASSPSPPAALDPAWAAADGPLAGAPADALTQAWAAAQAGHEAAYRLALQMLASRLRAWLRRRLASTPQEAEDLLQETLLALHLQRGTHRPEMPVVAWALAIARHKLVDHWRRQGRLASWQAPLEGVDEAELAAQPQEAEAERDLWRLLAQLPEAQRQAIALTRLEGLSMAQASERTGHSVAALKVQVHRGLKALAARVRVGGTRPQAQPARAAITGVRDENPAVD